MSGLLKIADALSRLTVLEAAELSKMLKDKWVTLLFDDGQRTRTEPLQRGESLYEFYDTCGRHGYNEFRSLVNGWLGQMAPGARSELITRMRYGKNRQFGSSLTELSLHAFILGSGYRAIPHPEIPGTTKRPDYAVTAQATRAPVAYVEVTTVNPPDTQEAEKNRENVVYNAIDTTKNSNRLCAWLQTGARRKEKPGAKTAYWRNRTLGVRQRRSRQDEANKQDLHCR